MESSAQFLRTLTRTHRGLLPINNHHNLIDPPRTPYLNATSRSENHLRIWRAWLHVCVYRAKQFNLG